MRPVLPWLLISAVGIHTTPAAPAVAVVTIPDVEAYTQALQGIREQIPEVEVWDSRDDGRLRENMSRRPPGLAIALGGSAAAVLERVAPAQLPLIYALVLECDLEKAPRSPRLRTAITVDIPPETLFAEITRLFPGRERIGVIRGPMQTDGYMKDVEQAAHRAALTTTIVNCADARELVEVFVRLKGHADLVWCPPSAQLYNSATLKPLLIASVTNRLPIIGFSEQFVQAGALFGGSPDFVDMGRQAAVLARHAVRNEAVPARQTARRFHFAYNQRVARLLGMKADIQEVPGADLSIIR